jgi:hypothetical protein
VGADDGARRRTGGDGGAQARATSRVAALWYKCVAGALFNTIFLKIFKQNWTKY